MTVKSFMRANQASLICTAAALLVASCGRQHQAPLEPGRPRATVASAKGETNITAENPRRTAGSAFPGGIKIQEVFAKRLSQDAAYEKFRGKPVSAVLRRPQLTWVADGGITVNLNVPKKPDWYSQEGEVSLVELRGKITEILFEEKHVTIECEPDDIRVLATE